MKAGDRGLEIFRSLEETKWSWFIANGRPAKGKMTAPFGFNETPSKTIYAFTPLRTSYTLLLKLKRIVCQFSDFFLFLPQLLPRLFYPAFPTHPKLPHQPDRISVRRGYFWDPRPAKGESVINRRMACIGSSGILKETELARLKYAAIDEAYLRDGLAHYSTITGLKNVIRAMINLKEMIVVRDITNDTSNESADGIFC
ncbi:hypothetical protein DL98DRAFT_542311 [Cadophora sp. DSE1049]|nr:hypothetical protein DL98DRAFT_542311 [Cadophora sp. DSE1049]